MSDWSRVRRVFEGALDLADAERGRFLDETCSGDPALREHVERLLAADSSATEAAPKIADAPPVELVTTGLEHVLVGRRIGTYEIRSVLGTGGMGTVFEAVQDSPHRAVALKTLRAGVRSDEMQRRFAYEAEVLGQLRHPAIAQVYETGTIDDEQTGVALPYFAIEFVPNAAPLDRFVTERGLDLRGTIGLFLEVLDGVLHGHERGIVHRDLKPQNILVDEAGRPKIIDFGIARAAGGDTTQLTRTGQILGTLSYMAPEQLSGESATIGTRADIYALGVILYELLTGRLPFDPTDSTLTEFALRVQNEMPAEPSRLGRRFREGVPVELDWITRGAMAAEPGERYAAVSELAADLQRFLRDEPVSVGPLTTAYLIRKFVRRHRVLATAGAVVCVAVLLGGIGMGWQWLRAESALAQANQEAKRARTVTEFYTAILQGGDLYDDDAASREPTLRSVVDAAAGRVAQLDDPLVEAQVLFNLGNIMRSRGDFEDSREHLERCLRLRAAELGDDHRDVAEVLNSLGLTCGRMEELELARQHYERALAILEQSAPRHEPLLGRIHMNLGNAWRTVDDVEAELHLRESIEAYAALHDPKAGEHATALSHLAAFLAANERVDEAVATYRESLAAYQRADRGEHPYAAMTRETLARILHDRGHTEEALRLARAAHAGLLRTLGESHDQTTHAARWLASYLQAAGAAAEAEELLVSCEAYYSSRYGNADSRAIDARNGLLQALVTQKRWDRALEVALEQRDAARTLGDAGALILPTANLGRVLQRSGRLAAAEREYRNVIDLYDSISTDAPLVGSILEYIVEVCEADGRPDDAEDARQRLRARKR